MAARLTRVMVCEGPDDLAAVRALLREQGIPPSKPQVVALGHLEFTTERYRLIVESAGGKEKLVERAVLLVEGTASERPDMLAVCFDPDARPQKAEFDFFEKDFHKEISRRRLAGPLARQGPHRFTFQMRNREVVLLAAPWRCATGEIFAGLADEHNLERVLISGILSSALDERQRLWATEATTSLQELVSSHGWKRAFRIWNAVIRPSAESFVDGLVQEEATRAPCLAALRRTAVAEALFEMLGIPGTSPA